MVYNRAELKISDHRPIFAVFQAEIRVVDAGKKVALSSLLLDGVKNAIPGDRLEEKLANIVLGEGDAKHPPPSSEDYAWWETADHPEGVFAPAPPMQEDLPKNPWDTPSSTISTPASSLEDLYTHAASETTLSTPLEQYQLPPKKPPPPPRTTKPTTSPKAT